MENEERKQLRVHPIVRQRWDILLTKIEQAGIEGLWVQVDEMSQEWQDLKAMAQHGIAFPCGLRAGGKESAWHAYDNARKCLARIV